MPSAGRGKLTLNTTPWTRVTEKGRAFGETPLIELPLPAGKHTLRLQNEQKKKILRWDVEVPAKAVDDKAFRFNDPRRSAARN